MVKMCLIKKLLVLKHCNIVNNDYQQDSRVLDTFVCNKSFGSIIRYFTQKLHNFGLLITLETEDKIKFILVTNVKIKCKI